MKHSVKIDLHLRSGGSSAPASVRLRVSWNGERCALFPGIVVEPEKWDREACRVKPNTLNPYGQGAGTLNGKISDSLAAIEKAFNKFAFLETRYPTAAELRAEFAAFLAQDGPVSAKVLETLGASSKNKEPGFFEVFDLFVKSVSVCNEWSDDTFVKYATIKKHLKASGVNFPPFSQLKESHLSSFLEYMRRVGIRNTTASKYVAYIREFLRWAAKEGYNPSRLELTWRPKFKGGDGALKEIIYLEWEELMALYRFEFPKKRAPYLGPIRDAFCFCCFTSLRYSDLAKLRRSDIRGDFIYVVTQKTAEPLRIELNRYSRAILEKYKDWEFEDGRALPVISNQKMNEQLKVIGKLCGFNTPHRIVYFVGSQRYEETVPKWSVLSTHAARRTFVVNALRLGIPSDVVMSWTGHSDHKAMKPYTKIVDSLKAQEMSKFDNYESGPEDGPGM